MTCRIRSSWFVPLLLAVSTTASAQQEVSAALNRGAGEVGGYAFVAYLIEARPGRLSVTVSSKNADPYLLLRAPSGDIREDDDGAGGSGASVTIENARSGRWLLVVTTYEARDEGDLTIRVVGAASIVRATLASPHRTMILEVLKRRGIVDDSEERNRRTSLLKEQLGLPTFRAQLMAKLRAAIAKPDPAEALNRKEIERLEEVERQLTAATGEVAGLAASRELVESLVRDRLRSVQAEIGRVSARITESVALREAYVVVIGELERLEAAYTNVAKLQEALLSERTPAEEIAGLRAKRASAQTEVDELAKSVAERLLDSRFVRELAFELASAIRGTSSVRSVGGVQAYYRSAPAFGRIVGGRGEFESAAGAVGRQGWGRLRSTPRYGARDPSVWLPALFPWPPPEPSSRIVLTDSEMPDWRRRFQTLGDVADCIAGALARAGYAGAGYWGVRDGFAIVAPIEQTDESGAPLKHEPSRWSVRIGLQSFSLAEYFRVLLTAPRGHFRVLAFVVTPHSFATDGARGAFSTIQHWASAGHAFLPSVVRAQLFSSDYQVTALVYEFQKARDKENPTTSVPGRYQARTHLVKSGVLVGLGTFR